jgi:hypothetical protein
LSYSEEPESKLRKKEELERQACKQESLTDAHVSKSFEPHSNPHRQLNEGLGLLVD